MQENQSCVNPDELTDDTKKLFDDTIKSSSRWTEHDAVEATWTSGLYQISNSQLECNWVNNSKDLID